MSPGTRPSLRSTSRVLYVSDSCWVNIRVTSCGCGGGRPGICGCCGASSSVFTMPMFFKKRGAPRCRAAMLFLYFRFGHRLGGHAPLEPFADLQQQVQIKRLLREQRSREGLHPVVLVELLAPARRVGIDLFELELPARLRRDLFGDFFDPRR